MFSATVAASVSETSGHSSSTVISTSRTSPGQPTITDNTSESNHLALILVCGYMNQVCTKAPINAALLQKKYILITSAQALTATIESETNGCGNSSNDPASTIILSELNLLVIHGMIWLLHLNLF